MFVVYAAELMEAFKGAAEALGEQASHPSPPPPSPAAALTATPLATALAVSARQRACAAALSTPSVAALCPLCRLGLEHIHRPHHEWRHLRECWSDAYRQQV